LIQLTFFVLTCLFSAYTATLWLTCENILYYMRKWMIRHIHPSFLNPSIIVVLLLSEVVGTHLLRMFLRSPKKSMIVHFFLMPLFQVLNWTIPMVRLDIFQMVILLLPFFIRSLLFSCSIIPTLFIIIYTIWKLHSKHL